MALTVLVETISVLEEFQYTRNIINFELKIIKELLD